MRQARRAPRYVIPPTYIQRTDLLLQGSRVKARAQATAKGESSKKGESSNMFDNLPFVGPVVEEGDELKRYLASDPVPVMDPIQWWQDRRKAYPRLSRMAIDYLTIPGE